MTHAPLAGRRIVVLGGTGFLGAEIVRSLVAAGARVRAVARRPPEPEAEARLEGAELMRGEIASPGLLDAALDGADHVVYAVGCPFPAESNLDPVGDVEQTLPNLLHTLQAARARPNARFTFLSSGGTVYGNPERLPVPEDAACWPLTSYGIMKLAAEHYVAMYRMLYGVDGHVLRIANAYGPTQRPGRGQGVIAAFLDAARRRRPVSLYGDGSIVRDYVHAEDVAAAVAAIAGLAEVPPICNVGSGVGHSVAEVLELIEQFTGLRFQVERLPDRRFDVRSVVLDVALLGRLVPWRPRSLRDGVYSTWSALLAGEAALERVAGRP